jgi:iron complex outermembrane receptor protein
VTGTSVRVLCTAIGLLASYPTFAQTDELTEIIVSAQRRAERLQDVPITITNIDANALTQANAQNLSDIVSLTPGLRFDYAGPFTHPSIRGVGSSASVSGAGPNVGIYTDGFYDPKIVGADFQLLDVESIQVLKGPQGTLFGRNTTAGAILVNTVQPSTQTHADVEASYGSFNTQKYQGYATTGLTDKIAVDLAAMITTSNGFLTNIATDNDKIGAYDNWTIRAGIKVDLTDSLSVLFRYTHERVADPTNVTGNVYVQDGVPQALGTIIPGAIVPTRPNDVALPAGEQPILEAKNSIYQLTTTLDLDFATLKSYSQYRQDVSSTYISLGDVSVPTVFINFYVPDRTVTQEFLLSSKPGGPLQWTTGAFYLDYSDPIPIRGSIFGAPYASEGYTSAEVRSLAAFADATYEVIDRLYLSAGVRYSHEETVNALWDDPGAPVTHVPDLTSNPVTPRAVVRYALDNDSSVYASFARGFKAPIYNLGGRSTVPIQAEDLSAFEVGYKRAVRNLSFDGSVFYYDYKNLQVMSQATVDGRPATVITNAAKSRIWGLEGQVQYLITSDFEVNLGAAYTDPKYTSYPAAPAYQQCLVPACGASFGTFNNITVNASGNQMERAPKVTSTLDLRYTVGLPAGKLALSSDLYYSSRVYFDPADQFSQSAYETLGVRAEWTDPSERFSVALYGDNVTNKRYLTQVLGAATAINTYWNPPATVGISLRAKFK